MDQPRADSAGRGLPSNTVRDTSGVPFGVVVAVLVVGVFVSSAPAIDGDFVYDDRKMAANPLSDGWDDVVLAFSRSSHDFLGAGGVQWASPTSFTYRPVTMVSLICVQAATNASPLAHHLMSLVLHITAMICVLVAVVGTGGRVPTIVAAGFWFVALHPVNAEAVFWINGRSDLMAGLFLAIFALTLKRAGQAGPSSWCRLRAPRSARAGFLRSHRGSQTALTVILAVLAAALGVLSKATFLPAAGVLVAAALLRGCASHGGWGAALQRVSIPAAALGAAALLYCVLRWAVSPEAAGAPVPGVLFAFETFSNVPRLVAIGVESVVVPFPRVMRLLNWEVSQPWTVAQVVSLGAAVTVGVYLLARRRYAHLVIAMGAVVVLAPTAAVCNYFWLGFDRYLYLPMVLLALAGLPVLAERLSRPARGVALPLAVATVVGVSFASFFAASFYEGHEEWVEAVVTQRPEEPTGYIMAANYLNEVGNKPAAAQVLGRMPVVPMPAALTHEAIEAASSSGRGDLLLRLVQQGIEQHPNSPNLVVDAMKLANGRGDWLRLAELSDRVLGRPRYCSKNIEILDDALSGGMRIGGDERRALERARERSKRCSTGLER